MRSSRRSRARSTTITAVPAGEIAFGGIRKRRGFAADAGKAVDSTAEQQARLKAARWVRGPMFGVDTSARSPAADKPLTEVRSHIREAFLAVGGDTRYCDIIREPTWILMRNSAEAAEWYGGYPVIVLMVWSVREMFSLKSNQMVEGSVCIGLRASCRVCARPS
jgi:hypothetical protein